MKHITVRLREDQIKYFDQKNLNRSAAIRDAIDFWKGKEELKKKLISLMKIVETSSFKNENDQDMNLRDDDK